jgi:hypothetical protein
VWAEAFGGCRHETMGEIDEERIDIEEMRSATHGYVERELGSSSGDAVPSEGRRAS